MVLVHHWENLLLSTIGPLTIVHQQSPWQPDHMPPRRVRSRECRRLRSHGPTYSMVQNREEVNILRLTWVWVRILKSPSCGGRLTCKYWVFKSLNNDNKSSTWAEFPAWPETWVCGSTVYGCIWSIWYTLVGAVVLTVVYHWWSSWCWDVFYCTVEIYGRW